MPKSVSTTPFCRPLAWLIQDGSHVSSKKWLVHWNHETKNITKTCKVYNSCFFGISFIHFNHLNKRFHELCTFFGSSHVRFGQCNVPGKGRASLVRIFGLVHWDLVGVKIHFFATRRNITWKQPVLQRNEFNEGNSHHLWLLAGSKLRKARHCPRRWKQITDCRGSLRAVALRHGDADFKPLNNNQCKSCDLSFCKVYDLKCPWDGGHGRVASCFKTDGGSCRCNWQPRILKKFLDPGILGTNSNHP